MAKPRLRRILAAADPHGADKELELLVGAAKEHDVQAVAVVGDLSGDQDKTDAYRSLFRTLGESGLPAYWVPGGGDAPVDDYLREAQNMEVVFPLLHGLHGTMAFAGDVLFAGIGGEISDDPDEPRQEQDRLRYPRWEAEYRLKLLGELDEHELVLLFATHPSHKGHGTPGSEALHELVATRRPRAVVCSGERGSEMVGRSLVVSPGSLHEGQYAVVDVFEHEAQLQEFGATA
jgi:uncharacterized protein